MFVSNGFPNIDKYPKLQFFFRINLKLDASFYGLRLRFKTVGLFDMAACKKLRRRF